MKIAVINGTEKRGVTYKLKEIFLESFKSADITEYYLPKDCPSFCAGCANCFTKGENACKDFSYVSAIENSLLQADLLKSIIYDLRAQRSLPKSNLGFAV